MTGPRVLALVLAGGRGSRLDALTTYRAKPAVPFGGHYRLIDMVLSNCLHSGISDVWVSVQYNPISLAEHLANGRPWDLDRNTGGLLVLPPRQGSDGEGWVTGTADGLWRNAGLVREHRPDALVVLSADAVYRMDYSEVVEAHLSSGAHATMVTTEVDQADAGRYGVVRVDGDRVVDYQLKPDEPSGNVVTNEVFVFSPDPVLDLLDRLGDETDDEEGLRDLGHALLPALVQAGQARAHPFAGYWRDVGTLEAYHRAHQELLGEQPAFVLDDPQWPVLTRGGRTGPSRTLSGARLDDVLLSAGSTASGTVERSVLGPGVVVEAGATVRDSVLLRDVVVRSGAVVDAAVVDAGAEIGAGVRVGGDGGLVLVGSGQRVEEDLAPGARLEAVPRG